MSHQEESLPHHTGSADAGRALLIIEGETHSRNSYQGVLEQAGYDVMVASHNDAGAVARKARPALIILRLADSSGMGLVRELRTQPEIRDTPVVALMRFDDAHAREQVVRAGATSILLDPVKTPMLLRQLRRLLARTHANPQSATTQQKMVESSICEEGPRV